MSKILPELGTIRVFISHSAEDTHLAMEVSKLLRSSFGDNISIFCDRPLPGVIDRTIDLGNWLNTIEHELHECDFVVCLVSYNFLNSRWFFMEGGGGILFGKCVIPICIDPVLPTNLPIPFNLHQAYSYSLSSLATMIDFISQRSGVNAQPVNVLQPLVSDQSTSNEFGLKSEALLQSVNAVEIIESLLGLRRKVGDCLQGLYNKYRGLVDMTTTVNCTFPGHCTITRESTIIFNSPAFHWYYQIFIDKPGVIKLLEATDLPTGKSLSCLEHLVTENAAHYSILFESMHGEGEVAQIRTTAYAENYLSDLFDRGLAQQFYRSSSLVKVRKNRQRFQFPISLSHRLECVIADCGDPDKVGQKIIPSEHDETIEYDVQLEAIEGHSGFDLIEFRLS